MGTSRRYGRPGNLPRAVWVLVFLLIAGLAAPGRAQLAESPWPSFMSDAQNTAQSSVTGPDEPVTSWRYETNGAVGALSIGSDGTIYYPISRGLRALNPDGSVRWTARVDSIEVSGVAPAVAQDGTIYVGGTDLHAFAPAGSLKWSYADQSIGSITAPAIGPEGTIYFGSPDSSIHAVNPDGSSKWTFKTSSKRVDTPVIGQDGTIYVGGGPHNMTFRALTSEGTVRARWSPPSKDDPNGITGTWVGPDNTIYAQANPLYALTADLKLQWKRGGSAQRWAVSSRGLLYGVSVDTVQALFWDGSLKWKSEKDRALRAFAAIGSDETVYVLSDSTYLYEPSESVHLLAFHPRDGSLKWAHRIGPNPASRGTGPVIGTNNTVYLATDSAIVAVGDATNMASPEKTTSLPAGFKLGPNYPNPFNPATRIPYTLPEAARVRLEVFDLLGRRVRVVTAGERPAGRHVVRVRAGNLPSGTYIYRLSANETVRERIMTLAK